MNLPSLARPGMHEVLSRLEQGQDLQDPWLELGKSARSILNTVSHHGLMASWIKLIVLRTIYQSKDARSRKKKSSYLGSALETTQDMCEGLNSTAFGGIVEQQVTLVRACHYS